jgi:type 1 glutamine amidotransferase/sugar phosphate isomerase/epimerase
MRCDRSLLSVAALAMVAAAALAQAPQTNYTVAPEASVYPRASGPYGPSPVGRTNWRVPTIFEAEGFFNWKVGAPASAFTGLTLSEAVVRIDKDSLGYVEGSNTQWASPEIRKNLDYNLTPEELTAVKNHLGKFHIRMVAYHVDKLEPDDRKVFEFAKSLGVEMIIAAPDVASLAGIDKLANEFGINVAVENLGRKETPAYWNPKSVLVALRGRSNRIGIRADTGYWMQDGIDPRDALVQVKDKLMSVSLRDRSSLGDAGRDVPLGYGVADTRQLLQDMHRLGVKPLFFTVNTTGELDATADLARSVDGFEGALLPVLGPYMIERSKTLAIRGASELTADAKAKIEAAIPRTAPATPQKPRKLLVLDQRGGHATIADTNYALELMGKSTGAYEAVFSNDLDNLKYDKIRQYDAVILDSTESDVSADPAVREGLLRYVREGGGIGGIHAASWSAAFWPELMEMFGASQGAHRTQPATLKIDDPNSPLMKSFGGQQFTYTDEYYRMADTGLQGTYYSRDKVHVLLSVDTVKTPDFNSGHAPFIRKDDDYAVAWIKAYGKGRVFFTCMGHTPDMFTDPKLNGFLLATVQFLLGDLPVDTTPSSEVETRK